MSEQKSKPLVDSEGKLEQFMPKIDGKFFRCKCGCNVFHKPDDTNLNLYQCNACYNRYSGE